MITVVHAIVPVLKQFICVQVFHIILRSLTLIESRALQLGTSADQATFVHFAFYALSLITNTVIECLRRFGLITCTLLLKLYHLV